MVVLGHQTVSPIERSNVHVQCPFLRGSFIRGSTVIHHDTYSFFNVRVCVFLQAWHSTGVLLLCSYMVPHLPVLQRHSLLRPLLPLYLLWPTGMPYYTVIREIFVVLFCTKIDDKNFLCKNSLPVLHVTYTANNIVWCMFDIDKNIITWKFLAQYLETKWKLW